MEDPEKVVCVGLNYAEHVEEGGQERPENPVLFSKFPTSITGPGSAIAWDPDLTGEVDYEVELALVIGEEARRVDPGTCSSPTTSGSGARASTRSARSGRRSSRATNSTIRGRARCGPI